MCTRATYLGEDNLVITGRSMDWGGPMGSALWVFPAGMARNGAAGPNSLEWTSRFGSVVASVFNAASVDGVNERGLVVNGLYLVESDYGTAQPGDTRQPISIAAWVQCMLDSFGSVAEAVAALEAKPLFVRTVSTPDGHAGTMHVAISDPAGDSAIFEYIDGALRIHHGCEYQVMTNSPEFSQQLALNTYWEKIGGAAMLPGTSRAADRFVRASYYISTVKPTADPAAALASVFGIVRNASVPLGIASAPGEP